MEIQHSDALFAAVALYVLFVDHKELTNWGACADIGIPEYYFYALSFGIAAAGMLIGKRIVVICGLALYFFMFARGLRFLDLENFPEYRVIADIDVFLIMTGLLLTAVSLLFGRLKLPLGIAALILFAAAAYCVPMAEYTSREIPLYWTIGDALDRAGFKFASGWLEDGLETDNVLMFLSLGALSLTGLKKK